MECKLQELRNYYHGLCRIYDYKFKASDSVESREHLERHIASVDLSLQILLGVIDFEDELKKFNKNL